MPPQPPKPKPVSALSALALVGQLGLMMVLPIVAGVAAGAALDRWLGLRGPVLIAGILLGLAGGVWGVYRMLAKEMNWKP